MRAASCRPVYVLDNQAELTGFICESFAFQVPAPGFALAAIKGLSHIAPRLPVLKLKNEDFSRDPKAVEALNHDPLTAHEVQPAITVAALRSAPTSGCEKSSRTSSCRCSSCIGTDDKATVCHGSQFFYETVGSKDEDAQSSTMGTTTTCSTISARRRSWPTSTVGSTHIWRLRRDAVGVGECC